MKKIYFLLLGIIQIVCGQQPPVHYPISAPVWEYMKYGNTPVSEYKGLVNLNIPLYTINVDNVSIPLSMNYYTGGIRVTEEAGLVGLGWSINTSIPMVIQQVKDKNDYVINTSFQKLPPFQGSPIIPLPGICPWGTTYSAETWPPDTYNYHTLPDVPDDMPYFRFVTDNRIIDWDGYYNMNFPNESKYLQMFEPTTAIIDTEPDIFRVTINGDEVKFCRPQIEVQNLSSSNLMLMPVTVLKGDNYFVELIANTLPYQQNGYNSSINGIKITCPNGSQYIFNLIEKANSASINYKLTQIITYNGKSINFNYSAPVLVTEMNKIDARYVRRNGVSTSPHGTTNAVYGTEFTSLQGTSPSYCGSFNVNDIDKYCQVPMQIKYEYYFLQSITSPIEQINFSYSNRLDNATMKKLDSFEVRNIFDQKIKKISFNYDYFISSTTSNNYGGDDNGNNTGIGDNTSTDTGGNNNNIGSGIDGDVGTNTGGNSTGIGGSTSTNTGGTNTNLNSQPLINRLKLISVTEEGNNPYVFEYNAIQLPRKDSFSIDYWGFFNGYPNTSFKPNLTVLGYPQFTENINNNFNGNINYTKACALEKIIYPTKGYTVFEYETHQFDNLMVNAGSSVLPITHGGGLRIKSVTDFNFNDEIISKKRYSYFGGKNINKRVLKKESTEIAGYDIISLEVDTPVIIATINNFLNQCENSMGDYIGYDRVMIREEGNSNVGFIERLFTNNENHSINPSATYYTNTLNYSNSSDTENGNIIEENIYNDSNVIQLKKKYTYFNRIKKGGYGMSKQYSGIKAFNLSDTNSINITLYPITLATFYPITEKKSFRSTEESTEFFNGSPKTLTKSYNYDGSGYVEDETSQENNAIFQDRNISSEHTTWISDLPLYKSKKTNNIVTEIQKFTYEPINHYIRLKKVEIFPNGNDSLENKKMSCDSYDSDGNILQYHLENGINICVVWGYKKNLPIAKIENVTYDHIQSYCNAIQTASNNNNEASLLAALETFRSTINSQFPNVMVTTYTHKPLVGISTITDAKGDRTTYRYDPYGKLINVRDKDNNILSENEYHFKP